MSDEPNPYESPIPESSETDIPDEPRGPLKWGILLLFVVVVLLQALFLGRR